jgi:hypothetical protein
MIIDEFFIDDGAGKKPIVGLNEDDVLETIIVDGEEYKFAKQTVVEDTHQLTIDNSIDEPASMNIYGNSEQYSDFTKYYQQVEFIESTGSQYIDTGVTAKSTLKMVTDIMPLEQTGNIIIGYHSSETNSFRFFNYSGAAYLDFGSGEGGNRIYGGSVPINVRYTYEIGNRYVKNVTTGKTLASASAVSSFTKTTNVYLNGNSGYAKVRWYSCQIYDTTYSTTNPSLVRDFVPCYRKSDGKVGMYDLAHSKFYPGSGTSAFLRGPACYPTGINIYDMHGITGCSRWNQLTKDSTCGTAYAVSGGEIELKAAYGLHSFGTKWLGSTIPIKAGGTYYVTCDAWIDSNVSSSTLSCAFVNEKIMDTNPGWVGKTLTKGQWNRQIQFVINVSDDWVGDTVYLSMQGVGGASTYSNLGIYIRKLMITYENPTTVWEPYQGGIPYPSLQYPQIVHNCGDYKTDIRTKKVLPNEYQELAYIESTGTQYINTGVKASNNTSVEVDCETLTPHSVYGTVNGLNYTASSEYPGGYFYYYNLHDAAGAGAPIAANSRMIIKQDKNKCYRNGLLVHTYTSSTFTEKSPMLLFARNGSTDGGVSKNDAGSVKIYYCKI